ncbi:hypothetical protein CAI21_02780 [Alkalilimnicola ehrlichii]|uniref:Ferritin-like domain-containing protein n=1 Tax=Alkalilimnicola ehrlichii TaxID=351052 RepID=A0A3E0X219_9GAMM|nr:hypothetical protein [Alkalilimnicola ehrlichii]RFA30919.1 hypothetical protein CAI21_02780 [Alkalilimnicola ehrlichii]RFA38869.1 hypothetical protein CAL65_02915 [Alkalilimnicola ehrlichii]
MALNIIDEKGTPLDQQRFTWRELTPAPISKLDDDAFTRVRVILMNGIEQEAVRFQHACARMNKELQGPLARVRRVDHHQQTLVNWLLSPDETPLEVTVAYEQVAIEVTAAVAQQEPDDYLAQVYRFGMLEDFDHLYRYSALLDRVEGKDANNITQSYTDITPGRPTEVEHRDPMDDLRHHYDRDTAAAITKLNALTIMAAEHQTRDYYMNVGPIFADPVARQLYAEIASIEEQHVTQYESIIDPGESWLEKWLLHEATEAYCYYSCMQQEDNPRIKAIWERMLDYELGQLHFVMDIYKDVEKRDPADMLPREIPEPIAFKSHREFVRRVLSQEVGLTARGADFVQSQDIAPDEASPQYREYYNRDGSPSSIVADGYIWQPGTELAERRAVH